MIGYAFKDARLACAANTFRTGIIGEHPGIQDRVEYRLSRKNLYGSFAARERNGKTAFDCGRIFGVKILDVHTLPGPLDRCSFESLEHRNWSATVNIGIRWGGVDDGSDIEHSFATLVIEIGLNFAPRTFFNLLEFIEVRSGSP
jgi:hypothetical protein